MALTAPPPHTEVDLTEYKAELQARLSGAWDLARCDIAKAQQCQKRVHDRRARDPEFRVGECVFLHFPSIKTGPAYKFARPYRGPYRIVSLHNGATLMRFRTNHRLLPMSQHPHSIPPICLTTPMPWTIPIPPLMDLIPRLFRLIIKCPSRTQPLILYVYGGGV